MDLGAHPMYLCRWLLGEPARISSVFTDLTGHGVEDNAVSVIEFANGATAISETGFVSPDSPFALELYGTEGSLLIGGPDRAIWLTSKHPAAPASGRIPDSALPEELPCAIRQWLDAIQGGAPVLFGIQEAAELTALMDAAYRSAREGRLVAVETV